MSIDHDRKICAEISERQGPNFSIGFRTLPDRKRWAIQASYAFCRIADDLADESPASDEDGRQQSLSAWRGELDRVYDGHPAHPVGRALAASLRDFDIPRESFTDLIAGCEEDLEFVQPEGQRELESYCDKVATSMGRICLSVFRSTDPMATDWARSLSHALQMTNILRDLREDYLRGRIYLPRNWMRAAGVDREELVAQAPRLGWYDLVSRGLSFARLRFAESLPLVGSVEPDSQLAVALMRGVYMEILEEIERNPCRVLRERVELGPREKGEVMRRAQTLAAGTASGAA